MDHEESRDAFPAKQMNAERICPSDGIVRVGNTMRLERFFRKAEAGEELTVGFIGGSITMDCLASKAEYAYPTRTFRWLEKQFPDAVLHYVNAGIGATDSQFGCARADADLLSSRPDLVFIEFSVNDGNTDFYRETYEGLIRRVLQSPKAPAVVLVSNVRYDDGTSAEEQHAQIAAYYDLPHLSMRSAILPHVKSGEIPNREITPDDLHPNDEGHRLVSLVLTDYLASVLRKAREGGAVQNAAEGTVNYGGKAETDPYIPLQTPLTANAYEHLVRIDVRSFRNDLIPDGAEESRAVVQAARDLVNNRTVTIERKNFTIDKTPQASIREVFRNGWQTENQNAEFRIRFTGSEAAIQWRRTINKPAPVARVVVDRDEDHSILLDANFEETWGDLICLTPLLVHGKKGFHEITLRMENIPDGNRTAFYLNGFLIG